MLPKVVETQIPGIFKFLVGKYKELEFKTEEELGILYTKYLEQSKDKYTQVKTMWSSKSAVPLYTIYENIDVYCE